MLLGSNTNFSNNFSSFEIIKPYKILFFVQQISDFNLIILRGIKGILRERNTLFDPFDIILYYSFWYYYYFLNTNSRKGEPCYTANGCTKELLIYSWFILLVDGSLFHSSNVLWKKDFWSSDLLNVVFAVYGCEIFTMQFQFLLKLLELKKKRRGY